MSRKIVLVAEPEILIRHPLAEYLRECGFEVSATPMSEGTRFANVLLIGHAR